MKGECEWRKAESGPCRRTVDVMHGFPQVDDVFNLFAKREPESDKANQNFFRLARLLAQAGTTCTQ